MKTKKPKVSKKMIARIRASEALKIPLSNINLWVRQKKITVGYINGGYRIDIKSDPVGVIIDRAHQKRLPKGDTQCN